MKHYIIVFLLLYIITGCANRETENAEKALEKHAYENLMVFQNPSYPLEERLQDVMVRLTLDEKIAQLNYNAQAIDRLNIPAYNWWNEALHGVARHGKATVFPQAIGLAATFDDSLIFQIATAISDEARAKYNAALRLGNVGHYGGLTFWSPNVNIFRDPRWGRGQETYGEDPYLTSRIGIAFVRGMQGDDPERLKTAACAKHFVVHSGPEGERHTFNAAPPIKDFRETYLPAFKALVQEAQVEIVMCAYNRTFGEPCCGSSFLMQDILREEWGFQGHVTSDCWALVDFHANHKVTGSPAESAALAFKSGVNVNCGDTSPFLKEAVEQGLIEEGDINEALSVLWRTRFRLGLFDPPESSPYRHLGPETVNSEEHQLLASEAAEKSIVLLKNDGVLPLGKDIKFLFVYGPNANNADVLLGNYFGMSDNLTTIVEGISAKLDLGSRMEYLHAFLQDRENINTIDWSTPGAHQADAIVVVMGLSGLLEGEEGEALASPTKSDRFDMHLPENQINYLRKLRAAGDKPIIAVLTGGSPVIMKEVHELADAVLYAWYPGEEGGNAVANVLFGDAVPSGRLPITFPDKPEDLPEYNDYSMEGRTYRFAEKPVFYPFGYGLSYTQFTYHNPKADRATINSGEPVNVSVEVTNSGVTDAEEVVQLYITAGDAGPKSPKWSLKQMQRVFVSAGTTKTVNFILEPAAFETFDEEGNAAVRPGNYTITIGGVSPVKTVVELATAKPVTTSISVQ